MLQQGFASFLYYLDPFSPPFTCFGLFPVYLGLLAAPQPGNSASLGLPASNVQASKYLRESSSPGQHVPSAPTPPLGCDISRFFATTTQQFYKKSLSSYFTENRKGLEPSGLHLPYHPPLPYVHQLNLAPLKASKKGGRAVLALPTRARDPCPATQSSFLIQKPSAPPSVRSQISKHPPTLLGPYRTPTMPHRSGSS